ncbi:RBD2 [[Candida] subhashii]|uniref:Rhomboid-type serine protease 2 n=1 Tax=[Candida] subhashii TaxID=561895 RepID=A0A8J5UVM6_9ASCO|nr:RBD2 [[Candida] subhashii]KAG7661129.1 RBD2 [[Candida] subhashii]
MMNFMEIISSDPGAKKIPALTLGLIVFTLFLYLLQVYGVSFDNLILYPNAPLEFNLNSISLYPLIHVNFIHWFLNICSIATPLARFEQTHGTIYTGITLNLLAVIAAIQYCIVGMFVYPNVGVVGLSGIAFSLFSFLAYKEHQHQPVIKCFHIGAFEVKIYAIIVPFIVAVLFIFLMPGSSFFGHLAGISTGYLLALGYLKVLYPPSKVLLFIEDKLSSGIDLLEPLVDYYKENDSVHVRSAQYSSLFMNDIESSAMNSNPSVVPPAYLSETRVLGTSENA